MDASPHELPPLARVERTVATDGRAQACAAVASPVGVFLASRAAIWLLAAALIAVLDPHAPGGSLWNDPWLHDVGRYVDVWGHWDGASYTRIASQGYGTEHSAPAFHPLYPLILAGAGRALGGHYIVAGILTSLAAGTAAFVLLGRLARERLGAAGARRTLLYLVLFPASIFLQAVYAESLFLLLAVAMFLFAERGRFLAASAVCGLALLTRPAGAALVPPLLLLAWRAEPRRRALASVLVAPAFFLVYPIVLWIQVGDPLASVRAQHAWDRSVSPAGPLGGIWEAVRAPITDLVHGRHSDAVLNVETLCYLLVFAVLAVLVWRWFGAAYGLFAACSLALPLSDPGNRWPLMSLPRLGLVVFPFFLALAAIGTSPIRHRWIVGVSGVLLVTSIARWTLFHWVA